MKIEYCPIISVEPLTSVILAITFQSSYIAETTHPGQFVNIKVSEGIYPLLRRPFSVAYIEDNSITIVFDVVGTGTRILADKKPGEVLNVLGPLGRPFSLPENNQVALIVAGGLGVAPFPLLTKVINLNTSSKIYTFYGGRSKDYLIDYKLTNTFYATDDGSAGFQGTVLELFKGWIESQNNLNAKAYLCGPSPMLHAAQELLRSYDIDSEVSLECVMACGVGICQGCPVEIKNGDTQYKLVCKDGPVFNTQSVKI